MGEVPEPSAKQGTDDEHHDRDRQRRECDRAHDGAAPKPRSLERWHVHVQEPVADEVIADAPDVGDDLGPVVLFQLSARRLHERRKQANPSGPVADEERGHARIGRAEPRLHVAVPVPTADLAQIGRVGQQARRREARYEADRKPTRADAQHARAEVDPDAALPDGDETDGPLADGDDSNGELPEGEHAVRDLAHREQCGFAGVGGEDAHVRSVACSSVVGCGVSVERILSPSPPMPLCTGCGVIGVSQADMCPNCERDYPTPMTRVARDRKVAWVAVRCSFQCRSCHFLSPLDEFDVDGSVECAQCGQAQRFDVDAWHEALAHAHALGDLAYPLPQGRYLHPDIWIESPYLAIGSTDCFAEHRQSSAFERDGMTIQRSLFIEAGPGQPVCADCRVALTVEVDARGAHTRCEGCGATATYKLPGRGKSLAAGLVGIVGEAHRTDRLRAKMESSAGGPVALNCPDCGGSLPATRDRVLTCEYCGTASLIPAQARTRDAGQVLKPDVWWVAFRGHSAKREALEAPTHVIEQKKKGAQGVEGLVGLAQKPKPETHLELGDPRPGRYGFQLMLNLGLPTIALLIAVIVYLLVG